MASNHPHTKRDAGGQADKSKDSGGKGKTPPPAPKGPAGKSSSGSK
jgi:hypothetical protein